MFGRSKKSGCPCGGKSGFKNVGQPRYLAERRGSFEREITTQRVQCLDCGLRMTLKKSNHTHGKWMIV